MAPTYRRPYLFGELLDLHPAIRRKFRLGLAGDRYDQAMPSRCRSGRIVISGNPKARTRKVGRCGSASSALAKPGRSVTAVLRKECCRRSWSDVQMNRPLTPASTVGCRAERGRWRPQADDTGFGFLFLTFGLALLA
jgi:hypothetical protein